MRKFLSKRRFGTWKPSLFRAYLGLRGAVNLLQPCATDSELFWWTNCGMNRLKSWLVNRRDPDFMPYEKDFIDLRKKYRISYAVYVIIMWYVWFWSSAWSQTRDSWLASVIVSWVMVSKHLGAPQLTNLQGLRTAYDSTYQLWLVAVLVITACDLYGTTILHWDWCDFWVLP